MKLLLVILPLQIILSMLIFAYADRVKPKPRTLFLLLTIFIAIQWMGWLVDINVSVISSLQYVWDLSEIFCAMTVLGLGNTIADLFVDASLASSGLELMALTGIFVGQMSNILIGFSLLMVIRWFKGVENTLSFWSADTMFTNRTQLMAFSILVWNLLLLASILGFVWFKRKLNKAMAIISVAFYMVFVGYFTVLEFTMPTKQD